MKRLLMFLCVAAVMLATNNASASVTMTVDSGPWYLTDTAWFAQAQADTVNNTFVNLRTGTYPGTTNVDPVDFLNDSTFYAAGPKLLYWLYYIPGETVANIEANDLLQTKLVIDWAGSEYALQSDHVHWASNNDSAWLAAGAMEDSDSGVIGQIRFSWSPMGETVEEHRAAVLAVQTLARGEVRYRSSSDGEWQYNDIQVNVVDRPLVPEPTTIIIWSALGGLGICFGRYRKRKAA